jgi:hypothetical protein
MFVKKSDVIESKILGEEEEKDIKPMATNSIFSAPKKSSIDISVFTSSKKTKEEMYNSLVEMISSSEKDSI